MNAFSNSFENSAAAQRTSSERIRVARERTVHKLVGVLRHQQQLPLVRFRHCVALEAVLVPACGGGVRVRVRRRRGSQHDAHCLLHI